VRSPSRFFAVRQDQRGVARSGGRAGWVVRLFSAAQVRPLNTVLTRSPSSCGPSARVGSVKPTRLFPHARGGPVGPSAFTPRLSQRPSRVMHRRVLSRGVPLPAARVLRGLAGREVLPSCRTRDHAHVRDIRARCLVRRRSWGSLPFAGLIPHAGGRRGASTAAKCH